MIFRYQLMQLLQRIQVESRLFKICPLRGFTSIFDDAGETVAIMDVFVLPPRESCSNRVNLLSLITTIRQNALMTCSYTSASEPFINHGTITWNQSPAGTPLHFWHKFLNDLFSHLHKKFHLSNQISNLKRKTYKVCKKHLNFSKTGGNF